MLRTLAFGAIAAIVGRQLYRSGAIHRFGQDLKQRTGHSDGTGNPDASRATVAGTRDGTGAASPNSF